ncbi:MAG: hypothetical protein JO053_12875, partial [Acidobacteria bacterium]|nr:hypothetical protein [Acidobacteriota bacterium]
MSVFPVVIHLLGRWTMTTTRVFFWACVVVLFALIWAKRAELRALLSARRLRILAVLISIWAVFALLSQIDWQFGNHIYTSSIVYDHALRIGLIGGIARASSLPPPDPFLRLGTAIPLSYHYFWYVLCSIPCREFPNWVGDRGAMMAGTVWTGLVLWAVLSLWLRQVRKERDWSILRWIVAGLLLAISGLDVLVFLAEVTHRLIVHDPQWIPYATLDWWSFDQVTNWID